MIVPLFGTGIRSKSRVMDSQGRENLYYEFSTDGDKTPFAIYGTPGLNGVASFAGGTPVRGWQVDGGRLFVVHGNALYELNVNLTATLRGNLTTSSGFVSMDTNGVQIMIVDGTAGYIFTLATNAFAQITDPDFPPNPTTVTQQNGFFLVTFREDTGNRSRVFCNETPYDGLVWNALDFRNAESNPDGIVRVVADSGEVKVLGEQTLESWGFTGGTDFPYEPIRGATAEVGLVARWSVARFVNGLVFLGSTRLGGVQVYQLRGYTPVVISTPELEAEFRGYQVLADAVAYAYVLDSHTFYVISFPTAGKTWMYDGLASATGGTPVWTILTSNGGRYLGALGVQYAGRSLVSDYATGSVYELNPDLRTDNGFPIARELRTKHFFNQYDKVTVDRFFLDMETGVGLDVGQGIDPKIMLSVSYDGGRIFGSDMETELGRQGEYLKRVEWRRLGTGYDFVFRIRMTDPVKFAMTGAAIAAEPQT